MIYKLREYMTVNKIVDILNPSYVSGLYKRLTDSLLSLQ